MFAAVRRGQERNGDDRNMQRLHRDAAEAFTSAR